MEEAAAPKDSHAALAAREKDLGNTAFSEGRHADAVQHFTNAIQHDPHNHILFSNRSAAYASLKDYVNALKDADQTVLLKPGWIKGYSRKGIAHFFLEQYPEAAEAYATGLDYDMSADVLRDGLQDVIDAVEKQEVLSIEDANREPPSVHPKLTGTVWVPLITPYTRTNKINWIAIDQLVNFYASKSVAGLFLFSTVGESAALTTEERLHISRRVVAAAKGRLTVVAVGNYGATMEDQVSCVQKTYNTGVDAVAVVVSQMARQSDSEDVWKENFTKFLDNTGRIPLGFYECTLPYPRPVTPEILAWAANTGRVHFHIDMGNTRADLQSKVAAVKSISHFRVFNMNVTTSLYGLQLGPSVGLCESSSSAYPDLYVWMASHHQTHGQLANLLYNFLTVAAGTLGARMPAYCKVYLRLFEKGFKGWEITTREWRQDKIREEDIVRLTSLSELVHVVRQQMKEEEGAHKTRSVLL